MSVLSYIILYTFIGSIVSLVGGIILLSNKNLALKISHLLASFAAGTLLGTAFFDLLPEALHESEHTNQGQEATIFIWTLTGIIFFFFLERFIHWFHHHDEFHERAKNKKALTALILIGDSIHNFLDGIIIAATFLVSIPLGIATTLAVAAHEIPQEIGDFALMIHSGVSRKKTIFFNFLSACASMIGAIGMFYLGEHLQQYLYVFLAITAGFFIYISTSDIIPELHHEKRKGYAVIESILLLLGLAVVWFAVNALGHGH